jgi:hypothetical protein
MQVWMLPPAWQLERHGHRAVATAQRGLQCGQPVLVDFSALPV